MSRITFLIFTFIAVARPVLTQETIKTAGKPYGWHETKIPMADGVMLGTEFYLPRTGKPCTTVLVRTPYDKTNEKWMGKALGLFDIALVVQDVRGKYTSDGEFYPFVNERDDGLQTLQWIRSQPWSDGKVAGWGGSYLGYTQWSISDSLDFMVPLLTSGCIYDFVYPDGVFSLESAMNWGLINASKDPNKISLEKIAGEMRTLPLSTAGDSLVGNTRFLDDWMQHENPDDYWEKTDFRDKPGIAMLSVAGWYDIFLKAQLRDFLVTGSKHPGSRLIIGPWCHGSQGIKNDYGGSRKTGDPGKLLLYTLKRLKGKDAKLPRPLKNTRYNLFVMERNEYVGSETWPPHGTSAVPFFLGPGGYLKTQPYPEAGSLTFRYDPLDPYPSHGGTALGDHVGPALQNDNLGRKDQVTFETDILVEPMILLGEISASIWLSSDVSCTDLVICIQDVFPDGRIVNIQEGAAGLSHVQTTAGKFDISVWATGYQVNAGHRLRAVVTSSWFPRFNRSLNSCVPFYNSSISTVANQSIHYGPSAASAIHLPVFEFPTEK